MVPVVNFDCRYPGGLQGPKCRTPKKTRSKLFSLTCKVLRNLNALLPVGAALGVDRMVNFILLQVPIEQEQFTSAGAVHLEVIGAVRVARLIGR